MKKLLCLFALFLTHPVCPVRAIDLTPRFKDVLVGGVVHRSFFFVDGDQKIGLTLAFDTRVEAGAGGTVFRFQTLPDAIFTLRPSPMASAQPFVGASLERYREAAHRLLPPNVTNIEPLQETRDPITSNGWHSYRFLLSYDQHGTSRISSITFLNLNEDEQLAMITSAPTSDFEEAAQKSWLILRTWQVSPLEPATGSN